MKQLWLQEVIEDGCWAFEKGRQEELRNAARSAGSIGRAFTVSRARVLLRECLENIVHLANWRGNILRTLRQVVCIVVGGFIGEPGESPVEEEETFLAGLANITAR